MAHCPCGATKTASQKRCNQCQKFATNYCRAKKDIGSEKALIWQDAIESGKIDKELFMTEARDVLPKELAKLIDSHIEELMVAEDEVAMVGTGDFLDEDDLKDKYAKKPLRLAAILKNAKRIWCNNSECELIEDMKYQSKESSSSKRIATVGMKAMAQQNVKRVKVEKAKPDESANKGNGEATMEDLNEGQLTKVTKWTEQVDKIITDMSGFVNTIQGAVWAEYCPPYVILKAQAVQVSAEASKATLANLTTTKRTAAKFTTIAKTIKDLQAEAKEAKRKVNLQMKEAKLAHGGEDGDGEADEEAAVGGA